MVGGRKARRHTSPNLQELGSPHGGEREPGRCWPQALLVTVAKVEQARRTNPLREKDSWEVERPK